MTEIPTKQLESVGVSVYPPTLSSCFALVLACSASSSHELRNEGFATIESENLQEREAGMSQHQQYSLGTFVIAGVTRILRSVRALFSERVIFECARVLALASLCALLGSMVAMHATPKAFAVQAKPPTDWSFYMLSTSTTTAYNLGCNQGNFDRSHSPPINSEVVLDFGQHYYGNVYMLSGITITHTQVQQMAEAFAHGYWVCTGSDLTSVLTLGIGINNYGSWVTYANGQTWGNDVAAVQAYNQSHGYASQVGMMGAGDLEPDWNSFSVTKNWVQGFSSVSGYDYLDFGDAGGCPQYSSNNGSCDNGWNQYDEWYVSWGALPALPTPEIYRDFMARQWAMISLYGAQHQNAKVYMQGPWDGYDLDNTGLTSSQAWNDLWTDLNNNSATAQNMIYSLEIHNE